MIKKESVLPSIFDLHVHTNRGSADSGLDPDDMFEEAKRIGLTGIMVANMKVGQSMISKNFQTHMISF